MVPTKRVLLTVGLVALLALSGCLGTGPLSDEQEQRVADRFEERYSNIDGFTATVHTEMDGENVSYENTAKVWQRPGTGEMRQEVLAPEERAGDVTVTNETTSISYDESENTYTQFDVSGMGDGERPDPGEQLRNMLDRFDVIYNGTETVDGTETHKVTLVPANESAMGGDMEMEMWVDSEEWFPVKQRMTSEEFGLETTTRYENVTLNPGIDDEVFTFDPPADATERDTGFDSYDTRENLADATNVTLPDPDVPEGYAFRSGTISSYGGNESVSLRYNDGDAEGRFSITVSAGAQEPLEDGESVEVGNRTARLTGSDGVNRLAWNCEDTGYSIIGELDEETLTDVGASIECPA